MKKRKELFTSETRDSRHCAEQREKKLLNIVVVIEMAEWLERERRLVKV